MLTRTFTEHCIPWQNNHAEDQNARDRNASGQGVIVCHSEKEYIEKGHLTSKIYGYCTLPLKGEHTCRGNNFFLFL